MSDYIINTSYIYSQTFHEDSPSLKKLSLILVKSIEYNPETKIYTVIGMAIDSESVEFVGRFR